MSRRIQAGDTKGFSVAFTLLEDPDPGRVGSSVAGSWGRLELWAAGRNLTQHRDRSDGLHDSITWYLRPLLHWLLQRRPTVLVDDLAPPVPVRVDRGVEYLAKGPAPEWMPDSEAEWWDASLWRWTQRHSLASARRGGVVPQVVFRRTGDEIEVSWDAELAPSLGGCRFLEETGSVRLDLWEFAGTLAELEDLTRRHFPVYTEEEAQESAGTASEEPSLWTHLRRELREAGRGAWLLGKDFTLGPLGLVAQGLDPRLGRADAKSLVGASEDTRATKDVPVVRPARGESWEEGYRAALELREDLGLDGQPIGDVESLLSEVGVETREVEISDPAVRSVALLGADLGGGPVVAWNRQCVYNDSARAKRASLLQGLAHLVMDRSRAGRVGHPHGSDWTGRRSVSRANAFAAMMLVPPGAIRALRPTRESLDEHCRRLSATPSLVANHAVNLGILTRSEAEMLTGMESPD